MTYEGMLQEVRPRAIRHDDHLKVHLLEVNVSETPLFDEFE